MANGQRPEKENLPLYRHYDQPAFVSDRCPSGGHRPICGELDEQVTSSAEHTLIGQILYLVGVVDGRRVDVVAVFNQQPKKRHREVNSKIDVGVFERQESPGKSTSKLSGYCAHHSSCGCNHLCDNILHRFLMRWMSKRDDGHLA